MLFSISGCTDYHSLPQCTRVFLSPHPHQRLLFVVSLMISIMMGVKCGFDLHFSNE